MGDAYHHDGGDFRDGRNNKSSQNSETARLGMHGKVRRGLDYTPLFRFLLPKVGSRWVEVHAEAVARLDRPEPIFWLVAIRPEEEEEYVRTGEASFFSGLRVDEKGVLCLVNPSMGPASLAPQCKCCTHTFNGIRFVQMFNRDLVANTSAARVA